MRMTQAAAALARRCRITVEVSSGTNDQIRLKYGQLGLHSKKGQTVVRQEIWIQSSLSLYLYIFQQEKFEKQFVWKKMLMSLKALLSLLFKEHNSKMRTWMNFSFKAQQTQQAQLFFLRNLKRTGLPPQILANFLTAKEGLRAGMPSLVWSL